MKANGSILLEKKGTFSKINQHNAKYAIYDFASMVKEADKCKDSFYYDSDEWMQFHAKGYTPNDPYWLGLGDIAFSMLFNLSNPVFKPVPIENAEDFDSKPEPRTHGGFYCDECSPENYVYDEKSINKWHNQWFKDNPDKIDWTNTNGIMPRRDIIIEILRQELIDLQSHIPSNGSNNLGLPHEKFHILKDKNWKETDDDEIVSKHNDIIIRHKGEELRAYSEKIGELICSENYFHCETELSDLEKDHGNKKVSRIYSIKKDGKYQFISIDTAHGKFELCDDGGTHQGEIRFDGSPNGNNTQDSSHSLQCVAKWKKKHSK